MFDPVGLETAICSAHAGAALIRSQICKAERYSERLCISTGDYVVTVATDNYLIGKRKRLEFSRRVPDIRRRCTDHRRIRPRCNHPCRGLAARATRSAFGYTEVLRPRHGGAHFERAVKACHDRTSSRCRSDIGECQNENLHRARGRKFLRGLANVERVAARMCRHRAVGSVVEQSPDKSCQPSSGFVTDWPEICMYCGHVVAPCATRERHRRRPTRRDEMPGVVP